MRLRGEKEEEGRARLAPFQSRAPRLDRAAFARGAIHLAAPTPRSPDPRSSAAIRIPAREPRPARKAAPRALVAQPPGGGAPAHAVSRGVCGSAAPVLREFQRWGSRAPGRAHRSRAPPRPRPLAAGLARAPFRAPANSTQDSPGTRAHPLRRPRAAVRPARPRSETEHRRDQGG
jgi:hypothetical protein